MLPRLIELSIVDIDKARLNGVKNLDVIEFYLQGHTTVLGMQCMLEESDGSAHSSDDAICDFLGGVIENGSNDSSLTTWHQ